MISNDLISQQFGRLTNILILIFLFWLVVIVFVRFYFRKSPFPG